MHTMLKLIKLIPARREMSDMREGGIPPHPTTKKKRKVIALTLITRGCIHAKHCQGAVPADVHLRLASVAHGHTVAGQGDINAEVRALVLVQRADGNLLPCKGCNEEGNCSEGWRLAAELIYSRL